MLRAKIAPRHVGVLVGMAVLFVGHVFFIGDASAFVLGLPGWYWAVTATALLLYGGVVVLIRGFAVGEAGEVGY